VGRHLKKTVLSWAGAIRSSCSEDADLEKAVPTAAEARR
jgi:hypothetical protein